MRYGKLMAQVQGAGGTWPVLAGEDPSGYRVDAGWDGAGSRRDDQSAAEGWSGDRSTVTHRGVLDGVEQALRGLGVINDWLTGGGHARRSGGGRHHPGIARGTHPAEWTWNGFPTARHRFDPPSGRFRVRYAASSPLAAAREHFPDRVITDNDSDLQLVALTGHPSALHLTHQANLDALELDDRISTGRINQPDGAGDPLLITCQQLADQTY